MSEREFQDQVIELARLYGWRVAHFRPAQTARGWRTAMQGDPGFPDLVLARKGRIIFAELKSKKGRPTPDQMGWINALRAPGVIAGIFYPEDFGRLADLLSDGRAHAQ